MLNDTIIRRLAKIIKENHQRRLWRNNNKHNKTVLKKCNKPSSVLVGNNTYGEINLISFGEEHKLKLGNFISIAPSVFFVLDAEHFVDHISTYPYKVGILGEKVEAFGKGDIIVDDDVWIGYGATILSGVHIGQGAIIAAGALVSKDVPPYSIVGGIPAKIIKKRYSDSLVEYMMTLDYSKLNEEDIRSHIDDLYICVDDRELDEIQRIYEWFPKRN